jgi:hypothetical protein
MQITELNIVPECYVDTKVAEIVGQASKKYNHQHGCGDVAKLLKGSNGQIYLGIIDEDRNKGPQARYFSEFDTVREENGLILKRHRDHKQYLIIICPEMEQWLMNDAEAVGIDPSHENFKLPVGLRGFKSMTKTKNIDKNDGFYRFVKGLIRQNAPSITTLKSWIELFKDDRLDILANG